MAAAADPRTAGAVPPLDDDHAGLLDHLTGAHPGTDQMVSGLRHMALDRLTADTTQTLLAVLGGSHDGTDLLGAIAVTVRRLTDPATNPCLRELPEAQQELARGLGEQWQHYDTQFTPREVLAETAGAIAGI